MNNYIYEYYQKIRSGEIVVGKWISMLYEKIITGMESGITVLTRRKPGRPSGLWRRSAITVKAGTTS